MYKQKETVVVGIDEIKVHAKNPKKHNDKLIEKSINDLGYAENIVIDENNIILSGHGRIKALKKKGDKEVEVIKISGWSEEEKEKYLLLANQTTILGGFDDVLLKGFDNDVLEYSGLEIFEEDDEEKYTSKIESPVYTPTGEDVRVSELFDNTKTEELLEMIEGMEIEDDVKKFLISAAYRFSVFNFRNIAEYYANCEDESVKAMIEKMALVIIDFNKAVEEGYVVMQDEILNIMGSEDEQ